MRRAVNYVNYRFSAKTLIGTTWVHQTWTDTPVVVIAGGRHFVRGRTLPPNARSYYSRDAAESRW